MGNDSNNDYGLPNDIWVAEDDNVLFSLDGDSSEIPATVTEVPTDVPDPDFDGEEGDPAKAIEESDEEAVGSIKPEDVIGNESVDLSTDKNNKKNLEVDLHENMNPREMIDQGIVAVLKQLGMESKDDAVVAIPENFHFAQHAQDELFYRNMFKDNDVFMDELDDPFYVEFKLDDRPRKKMMKVPKTTPFQYNRKDDGTYVVSIAPYSDKCVHVQAFLLPFLHLMTSVTAEHKVEINIGGAASMCSFSDFIPNLIALCKAQTTINIVGALPISDLIGILGTGKPISIVNTFSYCGFDLYPFANIENPHATTKKKLHRDILTKYLREEDVDKLFKGVVVSLNGDELKDVVQRYNGSRS